ncbi:MAG: RNA polymerase sporulation sigma factor SigE [Clostridia bacterium]|nr:RNA polymerase sporulation sigma factor SigE [Clostridia bacterium]
MIRRLVGRIIRFAKGLFSRFAERGIYYINGTDTLPPPLDADIEAIALEKKDTDQEMRSLLIEHNLRLVVYIAKKFESTGVSVEDLISIGTIGLIKSVNTFKADKNIKLATYASRCIENEILMYLRKVNAQKIECSLDEPLNVDWDGNELLLSDVLGTDENEVMKDLECEEERRIVRRAVNNLNEREKLIIDLRYGLNGGKEMTQKEVADMLGISQSYISRLEKKILERLKAEIELVI